MQYFEIDDTDRELIRQAEIVLEKNYSESRHTVGCAVLCSSDKIYVGVDIESCGYGPCAEPIAIGSAISNGERNIVKIVAIGGEKASHVIISPCGNCRQLIYDYFPECFVILTHGSEVMKIKVRDLIPDAYSNFD